MRTMGIDPSSSRIGVGLLDGDRLLATYVIEPKPKKGYDGWHGIGRAAERVEAQLFEIITTSGAIKVGIDLASMRTNVDTIRKIAYFEAAAMMACARAMVVFDMVRTTSARKSVLGKGNLDKEQVRKLISERYARELSDDETDAIVAGLWAAKEIP